jgi:acetyl/propionyl-CoA carboxylase alpha subunit
VAETEVGGIQTTLPFHRAMLTEAGFVDASELATTWVDAHWDGPRARASAVRTAALAAGLAAFAGDGPAHAAAAPTAAGVAGEPAGNGSVPAWRSGGRALAVDRWPA